MASVFAKMNMGMRMRDGSFTNQKLCIAVCPSCM